jgi:uncharacterized damage-inducible protein DinB
MVSADSKARASVRQSFQQPLHAGVARNTMIDMQQERELSQIALEALRSRLTSILPALIRSCIEELSEQQIWWRPNDESNSVGNLLLHLSGSIRHYLNRGVGGVDYKRNRPAEFAERGPIPKQQLLSIFNETIEQATRTLNSFDASRLTEPSDEPDYYPTIFDLMLGVSVHLAAHAGQVLYITKMLKASSLDDLWIRAHRA